MSIATPTQLGTTRLTYFALIGCTLINWVSCIADRRRQLSCVGEVSIATCRCNSTRRRVELRRYKQALSRRHLFVLQLVPYYVLNVINFPGLPGIFLAVLFSGSMRYVHDGTSLLFHCNDFCLISWAVFTVLETKTEITVFILAILCIVGWCSYKQTHVWSLSEQTFYHVDMLNAPLAIVLYVFLWY